MTTLELVEAMAGRLRRTFGHLRAAGRELFVPSARDLRTWLVARRVRVVLTLAALAAIGAFFATTRVTLTHHWYGVFLLESRSGRPLELKDDLRLGDGSRLIWGATFPWIRDGSDSDGAAPRLQLTWDEEQGIGTVVNLLPGGARLETYFSRYVQDDGGAPAGLFVGGAAATVAASQQQDQSGMALRDASGWHHVWCNVNELLVVGDASRVTPGDWKFRGSRVLIEGDDRVVVQSDHEIELPDARLRMERFAYFSAGRTFFRLGVNLMNVGDAPVRVSYGYGDEPWVGRFGSADGNIGWDEQGVVPVVSFISLQSNRWGGILDTKTGLANFISWEGSRPDVVYFGNSAGTPKPTEVGRVLASNEVFVGLEWRDRVLEPGETLPIRLAIGMAARGSDGNPIPPPAAASLP